MTGWFGEPQKHECRKEPSYYQRMEMGSVASYMHRDKSSAKTRGGSERKMG